jgi:tetratricopeptide (TPR) repeat protein
MNPRSVRFCTTRMNTVLGMLLWLALIPAHADVWNRDTAYAERVAALQAAIAARPNDANALVDLAAFYLKPLAPRTVEAADGKVRAFNVPLRNEIIPEGIKNTYAVPWVFRGDTSAAWPFLTKALAIDPRNVRAAREMAMYYRMRGDLDRMKPYMETALGQNPLDLDMCRLYLDHRTGLARVLNDQAIDLRTPKSHEEVRADGRYLVTTYPSEADHARANDLDRQAQDARRDAIVPLQRLAGALKDDPSRPTTPAKQAKWRLATAVYFLCFGELQKAAGTAAAGLREDPTDLDSLDYVVDLVRGTRTRDKLAEYKAILDRWGGVDSSPTIPAAAPRGPRR